MVRKRRFSRARRRPRPESASGNLKKALAAAPDGRRAGVECAACASAALARIAADLSKE